jgi:hypothetical protein
MFMFFTEHHEVEMTFFVNIVGLLLTELWRLKYTHGLRASIHIIYDCQ